MGITYPTVTPNAFSTKTDNIDDVMAAHVNGLQTAVEALEDAVLGNLVFGAAGALTIASGAVTVTKNYHTIDTEGAAASDDLDTISGGQAGQPVFLRAANDARSVVIKHNTGNILTFGGTDITLDDASDLIAALYDAAAGKWYVMPAGSGGGSGSTENLLINGGFDLAQRQAPATLTTIATDKCSADRWRISRENAELQYQRGDATGESGLTCKYFGAFKKITNTGKFMIYQILEGVNSVPLRGKVVTFQAKMKASGSKTIRMAVLELNTSGTLDTIPATFVSSWGSASTDPTLGTNLAIITAAQSKSVTTSWAQFSVSVTVPTTSKNIIVAVWSDSGFAANDILYIAEAGVYVSAAAVSAWSPRLIADELTMAQRYYEKSYDIDIAPGTTGAPGGNGKYDFRGVVAAAAFLIIPTRYKVEKMKAPTVTIYDDAGNVNKCSYITSTLGAQSDNQAVTVDFIGTSGARIYTDSTTSKLGVICHWLFEAEL